MSTLQIVGSLALWAGGWLTIGILIGQRLAQGGREDTPLRRAQTVEMPDRSRWGKS